MPYIIEETVLFDEVKGRLSNIETKDEVSLPPTAGCILLILLASKNNPVERNDFIEQVHLKFGFDLSNNTLNQYISLLRKNIRNLGVDSEVIITVPKIGFYITDGVKISESNSFLYSQQVENGVNGNGNGNGNKKNFIVFMIMVLVVILQLLYLLSHHIHHGRYPLEKQGKIGECDLYLPVNLARVKAQDSKKSAAKLAERYLPCSPGSVFIYDISALNFLNGTGKVYLSRCTGKPGEDTYSLCSEVVFNEE